MSVLTTALETTVSVPLYGGALTVLLPTLFEDASLYREVPDTQEVYVSRTHATDVSVIVDLLERVAGSDDATAVATHWEDVAPGGAAMEARASVVFSNLSDCAAYSVEGMVAGASTKLLMMVARLREQRTDLVVTVNVPAGGGDGDSEAMGFGKGVRDLVADSLRVVDWGLFGEEA